MCWQVDTESSQERQPLHSEWEAMLPAGAASDGLQLSRLPQGHCPAYPWIYEQMDGCIRDSTVRTHGHAVMSTQCRGVPANVGTPRTMPPGPCR